jgi:hypothetical protein
MFLNVTQQLFEGRFYPAERDRSGETDILDWRALWIFVSQM